MSATVTLFRAHDYIVAALVIPERPMTGDVQ